MKTRQYISLLLALFISLGGFAQNGNRLSIPELSALPGRTISLPVHLDNTAEIVALQFTLQLPAGSSLLPASAVLSSERTTDHLITLRQQGEQNYLCLIYSPTNSPLRGRAGMIMSVDMQVGVSYAEGSTHEFAITDVTLAQRDGSNSLTDTQLGKLTIQKGPDLLAHGMTVDAITYSPGSSAVISWQVENIGALTTEAGWTEYITLKNSAGVSTLVGTATYDATLAATTSVSRTVEVLLPFTLAIDGDAYFEVEVRPQADTGESLGLRGNNIASTATSVSIPKQLKLTLPTGAVEETYSRPVKCTLTRSGNRSEAESFTLQTSGDCRLAVPAEVTIPAGSSATTFYINITDNDELDEASEVVITASGNDYPEVEGQVLIEDNEYPYLNVSTSKENLSEGETFQLTITATRAPKTDLQLTLSSESSGRFSFPGKVTLPAGETSVVVNVTAKDDDLPSLLLANAFTVQAPAYNKGEVIVVLEDDDVPALELTLTPNKVSEAYGPIAVSATLRRTGVTNNKITVKLNDDSNGGIYYGLQTIELAQGVEEVHFNLGPIDNANVDGDRIVNVTAAVYISSCSCSAAGESAGVVSSQLEIMDDDGPALTLKSSQSTLKEGSTATFTVSRNTPSTEALTLMLSSDQDSRLSYEKSVTIPAGKNSVQVTVASISNDTQGDSFTAVFTAKADGFSTGTCYMMVTDQTLPDARISIKADKTEAEVGSEVALTVTVSNEGNATLPAGTEVKLYSASSSLTLRTSQAMEVGQSETFIKTVLLPTAIGVVRYYAVVNENDGTSELSKTNNTSNIVELRTTSPYSVAVNIEKSVYDAGESVAITGKVSGASVSGKEVEVYVVLGSARESILTRTDANGDFAVVWKPSSPVSGHFVVGACYPGENKISGMCSFDVHGLRTTTKGYIVCDVLQGETKSGAIGFENMSELPLTGVRADVIAKPVGCDLTVNIPTSIEGAAKVDLAYMIKGTTVTEQNEWEEIKLRISTNEGVIRDVSLWFYCRALEPKLMITPDNITTTMTKGQTRDYPVTITNIGKAATSDITLIMPDWMTSATGTSIAPLGQGESTTIMLKLMPNDGMELNRCVHGSFGINYGGSSTAVVNMAVTPVSEEKGTLVVDVRDDYTFYAEGAPHVEGAAVVIKRPAGEVIDEDVSGQDGICRFELPEGSYIMTVSAPEHTSKTRSLIIDPGVETHKSVTLSMGQNAIKMNYSVKKTDVADAYVATTEVTYKTNVPVPVVVLTCPTDVHGENMQAGEQKLLTFLLTNKGLISANNVYLDIPDENDYWSMKALSSTEPFTLAPQTSKSITVLLTKKSGQQLAPRRAQKENQEVNPLLMETYSGAKSTFDRCMANMAFQYFWICGDELENNEAAMTFALATCTAGAVASGLSNLFSNLQFGGIGGGGGGGGNGGGPGTAPNSTSNNTYKPDYSQDKPVSTKEMVTFCDPEDAACGMTLIKSMLSRGNGIGKKGIEGLLSHSEKLQEINERYKKAEDEGRSQDDVDKELIREFLKEKWDEIKDVVKDAQAEATDVLGGTASSSDLGKVGEWMGTAKEVYEIAKKCEHTYNKLNPRQPNGRGDNIQTMYDYAKLLANGYDVVTEFMGTEKWGEVFEQYGMDWINHVTDYDWANGDVESFFASAPDITKNEDVMALAERMTKTYDHFLYLYHRDVGSHKARRVQSYTDDGIEAVPVEYDYIDFDRLITLMTEMEELEAKAVAEGYESLEAKFYDAYDAYQEYYNDASEHVCATLKLEFKQDIRLTREAFEGTLEVFNGHESKAIRDFRMNLTVTDMEGNLATSDVIDQKLKENQGFGGQTDELYGSWTLDANVTGTAVVLFTPSALAAPESPSDYLFGGKVTYIDPFTELEVTRELIPVQMQINPSPQIELTYFLQSNIYGDDPLTPDVVEAKIPAEFAVLVRNKGYGLASNFQMVTHQPEITVNEKALKNEFMIVSSSLNGGGQIPAIGEDVLTEFGNIAAQGTAFAQWWFESDLSGSFSEYNVKLESVSYDNAKMSLVALAETPIHNLIRSIKSTGDSNLAGFLCNDDWDVLNRPDMLYLTNGETADVAVAGNVAINKVSATDYELTVTPSAAGWNYGVAPDPTQGYSELKSVVRKSNGKEISLRNFWQTDRTLIDGKDWLYDNNLHFVDNLGDTVETYILTFEPTPELMLDVVSFEGIPAEGEIAVEPVESVSVTFSKPIDPETFDAEDITLNIQAVKQDASLIAISTEDNKTFTLDLSQVNVQTGNGYYTLFVQTSGITDSEGYPGKTGKSAGWIYFQGGLVQLLTSVYPSDAGSIQRVSDCSVKALHAPATTSAGDKAQYGSTITLTATPEDGYEFTNWTLNGNVVSSEPTFSTQAISDMDIVANFHKKKCAVMIDVEGVGGSIDGGVSRLDYEFGTTLTLTATPDDGYVFEGWTVDGVPVEGNGQLTLTLTKATDIRASFIPDFTPGDVNGDGDIDIADVMAIHAHILQASPQNFNIKAADINADGDIDIADVMMVHNLILEKQLNSPLSLLYQRTEKRVIK